MIPKAIVDIVSKLTLFALFLLIIYYLINIGNTHLSEDKKIKINKKKILLTLLGLFCFFILYYLFDKYTILSDTLYTIIFSAILAYLFNPLIDYMESKNIKRIYGVLILYLSILAIIIILAFIVAPKSSRELRRLGTELPRYIENMSGFFQNFYDKYTATVGDFPAIFKGVQDAVVENLQGIEEVAVNGLKNFFLGAIKAFSKVISLVLTPILTLYFLADKDYFIGKMKKLIPEKNKEKTLGLLREIDDSMSKFVRGRLLLAASVGFATTIFLLIAGVDFAIFIGILTGVADIIPYIGPFIGYVPAVFFAFLESPIKAVWVSIFFVLIQWLGNNVLAPKIIGDTVGIHPVVILLAIIVGGGVFGVVGMILSIPVVAVSMILIKFAREEMKKV